jgi:hypothetical protein
MSYSKKVIERKTNVYSSDIGNLYKDSIVNYTGITSDTNELYTEVISEVILKNLDIYNNLTISRKTSYYKQTHSKISIKPNSNRLEENIAKRLVGIEIGVLGKVLDFQIPLKDSKLNKGLGKIDLLSFNNRTNTFYLIEFKYNTNKETLLRASLEIYTYYKSIDQGKLVSDFLQNHPYLDSLKNTPVNTFKIKPIVLLTKETNANKELQDLDNRPKLKKLLKQLDLSFFSINIDSVENQI